MLAGAGAATAAALVTLAAVDDGAIDRGADIVLLVSLLALSRAAFRLVDPSDDAGVGEDAPRRERRADRP
jgi:hypothetical protein